MNELCPKCTGERISSVASVLEKEYGLKSDAARAAAVSILMSSQTGIAAITYNRIRAALYSVSNLKPLNTYQVEAFIQPKTLLQELDEKILPDLIAVEPMFLQDVEGEPFVGQAVTSDTAILGYRIEVQRRDLMQGPNTLRVMAYETKLNDEDYKYFDCSFTLDNPGGIGQIVILMASHSKNVTAALDPNGGVSIDEQPDDRRFLVSMSGVTPKLSISIQNLQARVYPIIASQDAYNRVVNTIVAGKLANLPAAFIE